MEPLELQLSDVSRLAADVLDEVEQAVVGKREALTLVLGGILAGGHVLLEDFPGLGKTLAARSFAQTLGLDFTRAQFTPDLLPADLTGLVRLRPADQRVLVPPRPVVHRAPPRRRDQPHTAARPSRRCSRRCRNARSPSRGRPSCWPAVPRARHRQPDRVRRHLSASRGAARPLHDADRASATRPPTRSGMSSIGGCTDAARSRRCARSPTRRRSRDAGSGRDGHGRREHQPLLRCPRDRDEGAPARDDGRIAAWRARPAAGVAAFAIIAGRDYVTPEDVKAVAEPVLAHRITVKPEMWMSQVSGRTVVQAVLSSVATPDALEDAGTEQ